MSDANEIIETATADCPNMNLSLAGVVDDVELEDLGADIADWSDGYNATADLTFSATYYASMETDTSLELAFGTEALLASAPNGAYSIVLDFAWNGTDSDVDVTGDTQGYYIPSAVATTGTSLAYDTTGVINMYSVDGSGALVLPKYGWSSTDTWTGDGDIVADGTANGKFYMPKEEKTDGETTATGDRLDHKDKVSAYAGDGTPTAMCGEEIKIKLGAATLAATSLVLATAMTI